MTCAFLQAHRDEWRVTTMCRVLGVSRARYDQWVQRPVNRYAAADAQLAPQVRATFLALHRRCGSPRVPRELRAQGTRVGKQRVERLMRQGGLRAKRPRPFRVTTQSAHAHPVAPNRLQRQFAVPALNQVWGADITYLPTAEGWLYLAVVLDLCSRRVIGWGAQRPADAAAHPAGAGDGARVARPVSRRAASLGSGQSIRERGVSPAPGRGWDRVQHEPRGRLLG